MATYSDPTIIQSSKQAKPQSAAVIFLASGLVALLGSGWLFFQTIRASSAETDAKARIQQQEAALANLQPVADELVTLDQAAKNFKLLFNAQKQWDVVLGTVEQRLYKNMAINNLELADSGGFTFTAVTPTYIDYAKIYRSLTDEKGSLYFSSARPGAIEVLTDEVGNRLGIQFSFLLKLQPQVLQADAILFLADLQEASN